jgi:hypothetical protein
MLLPLFACHSNDYYKLIIVTGLPGLITVYYRMCWFEFNTIM